MVQRDKNRQKFKTPDPLPNSQNPEEMGEEDRQALEILQPPGQTQAPEPMPSPRPAPPPPPER